MADGNPAVRRRLFASGYSTVWEDEQILDDGLRPRRGDRVLTITSGGCHALKLLLADVAEVVCVDRSPYQTALVELKAAAARTLAHGELWELLGLRPSRRRVELYRKARAVLSPDSARYWDDRSEDIESGVGLGGGHDRMLHWVGRAVTALHGAHRIDGLLACRTLDEQRAWIDTAWNTRRWRLAQRVLLGDAVLGRLVRSRPGGRPPAVAIRDELDHVLRDVPVADNFYLFYLFRRTYPSTTVCPAWLAADQHEALRARLDRLACHTIDLEAYLAAPSAGTFDCFNLSNIFDWMSAPELDRVVGAIVRAARPGARLCYWTNTLNEPRELSNPAVRPDRPLSAALTARRRTPGYSGCMVATIDEAA